MSARPRATSSSALALAALLALVPLFVGTRYIITQMTLFFIWAIVVTQWNLVLGVAGIFSLAQMALFAVGAYATAMLGYYFAVPVVLADAAGGPGDGAGQPARSGSPACGCAGPMWRC